MMTDNEALDEEEDDDEDEGGAETEEQSGNESEMNDPEEEVTVLRCLLTLLMWGFNLTAHRQHHIFRY